MNALDASVVKYLQALKQSGVQLGLERMRRFVAALGDPQFAVPVIHIAGTNGKGSVAAMLELILRRAGCRTGLYTSPHLVRLGERIQVNRQPLAADEIAAHVRAMQPQVDAIVAREGAGARPSFFEFMTAMAFRHFAQARCDVAIIEVGMGGRLDATNVVTPEVSVITSIGLDHCEFLGSTVDAIAAEKAGIIKPRRPVVIGWLPPAAERVIRAVATANGAPVVSVRGVFGEDAERYPLTNLRGEYQRVNAATATLVARQWRALRRNGSGAQSEDGAVEAGGAGSSAGVSDAAIFAALAAVDWPGRWQRLSVGGRPVILDASHNAEGAVALERNLAALAAETGEAPVVVTGVLGSARARPLLEAVCRHARELHLVVPAQPRACSYAELEQLIPPSFRGRVVRSSVETVFPDPDHCLPDDNTRAPVVVTGSIYLAGQVLARLDPSRGPLEHELQDF